MPKISEYFVGRLICPETQKPILHEQWMRSMGICPHCGHDNNGTFTHSETQVGRWETPTFWERLHGHRQRFIPR